MQANDVEDHHISINSKYGRFDETAYGTKSLDEKNAFKITKPDFFLRVHYDCGCGETFDTDFMPRNKVYLSEEDANAYPLDYGIVELSKCA
uniref:Peptidase M12A domain-containing protein n=1 Tax=Panagrellus redivivus TaxID=6233 RepID=A0A7E4ZVH7_PANRE